MTHISEILTGMKSKANLQIRIEEKVEKIGVLPIGPAKSKLLDDVLELYAEMDELKKDAYNLRTRLIYPSAQMELNFSA